MTKPLVGKKIKIVKGKDYLGYTGIIEYCKTCCRAYRIQFDGIGNNESFKRYRKKLEIIKPNTN